MHFIVFYIRTAIANSQLKQPAAVTQKFNLDNYLSSIYYLTTLTDKWFDKTMPQKKCTDIDQPIYSHFPHGKSMILTPYIGDGG